MLRICGVVVRLRAVKCGAGVARGGIVVVRCGVERASVCVGWRCAVAGGRRGRLALLGGLAAGVRCGVGLGGGGVRGWRGRWLALAAAGRRLAGWAKSGRRAALAASG